MPFCIVLDNFVDRKYSRYFSRYYCNDVEVYRASRSEFPNEFDGYDNIILTGSEESIVNDRGWIDAEMGLVRELIDTDIPLLGICFGHQLIVRALLGRDGVRRRAAPEIGWEKVTRCEENALFKGIEPEFYIFLVHFDEVCALTNEFEVLARSSACAVQAFQLKHRPIWGVQFHPEIGIEAGKKFVVELRRLFPELDLDIGAVLNSARDSGTSRRLFENFYLLGE